EVDAHDVRHVHGPAVAVGRGGGIAVEDRAAAGGEDHVAVLREDHVDAQVARGLGDVDVSGGGRGEDAGLRHPGGGGEQGGFEEVRRRADGAALGGEGNVHADDVGRVDGPEQVGRVGIDDAGGGGQRHVVGGGLDPAHAHLVGVLGQRDEAVR